jgi:EAL domain-containing protein (putative c-di-GMP-specific phosphodiesterase class I)
MAQLVGVRVLGALKKPLDRAALATLLRNPASALEQRAELVTRHMLKQAISEGRIQPVYQPKLDNRSRSVTGVEVLLRVVGDDGELQSPQPFIIAAERDRMIDQLTDVIFEQAVSDAARWKQEGFEPKLAFNLSPVSLSDLDLPDRLKSHFVAAGLEPTATTLEITENQLLDHHADVLDILSRLRLAGFRLSMDDFGTGATSMEQLRLFPFNELKIDKSFVLTALEDEFARTTVETGARLAAMLGLDVVAEGVETREMLNFVIRTGASHAQGFYIARPLAARDVTEWMRSNARRLPELAA